MNRDASDKKTSPKKAFRGGRPKALGVALERVTKPLFGKRGLADGAIVRHWSAIVGPEFARYTAPEKLVFPTGERAAGTLHLRVSSGSAATLIQHQEPAILERINGYFGYRAVARLALKQGPLPVAADVPAERDPVLPEDEERALSASLTSIEDEELRDALQSLGRLVKVRSRGSPED